VTSLPSGLRWQAYGSGSPVTLVAHGLGATPGEARIPASGLPGTRIVVTLPSHGSAPDAPADYWSYPTIAADLRAVAREVGATPAVGVSLGAGALTRLLADEPEAFERVVLLLPAVLDQPRAALSVDELAGAVVGPPDYLADRRAAFERLGVAAQALPGQIAVPDVSVLSQVNAPVLVIGATGDPLHPEAVAKATAAAFPHGRLELVDSPAPLITHRREVRGWLVDFLGG
jgi:pimeloyl-ACP methyl ester carboxylesterase